MRKVDSARWRANTSLGIGADTPQRDIHTPDQMAGEGDPDNHFYRICAIDLGNNTHCAKNQACKFTEPVLDGLNLESIPLVLLEGDTENVLWTVHFDVVWSYNSIS